MLKQRIISAAIMLAVFLLFNFVVNDFFFALLLSAMAALAAWEWYRLAGLENAKLVQALAIASALVIFMLLAFEFSTELVRWFVLLTALFWATVPLIFYLKPERQSVVGVPDFKLALTGFVLIAFCALFLNRIHTSSLGGSPWLCLYVLSIAWIMDIGAYFAGKKFGRRKLAPVISPGKTWEGAIGGMLLTVLFLVICMIFSDYFQQRPLAVVLGTLSAAGASIIGDLYESRLKRSAKVKDSSHLIPGHGGILDRVDGQLAAIPVFFFFWTWL